MSSRSAEVWVAAELGNCWPAWLQELLRGSARRVFSQGEAETPAAFVERFTASMTTARGRPVGTVVVLCNERTDPTQQAARHALLEALLGNGARRRGRRVVLAADGRATRVHRALAAVSERARASTAGALELRFEEPPAALALGLGKGPPIARVA